MCFFATLKCAKIKHLKYINVLKLNKGSDALYIETFKEKLTEARKDTGFTQKEVSKELNIPRSTLANYETGRTEPDLETLAKLIDFYQVSADWILGTGKKK